MVKFGYRLARGVASGGMSDRVLPEIKAKTIEAASANKLVAVCTSNYIYALCLVLGKYLVGFEVDPENYPNSALHECKKYIESDKDVLSMLTYYIDGNISRIAKEHKANALGVDTKDVPLVVHIVTKDGEAELDLIWQHLSKR